MGKLEELSKKYKEGCVIPIHVEDEYDRNVIKSMVIDAKDLLSEVHRLRDAIEKAYKGCNHPSTIKILRDALNGEET